MLQRWQSSLEKCYIVFLLLLPVWIIFQPEQSLTASVSITLYTLSVSLLVVSLLLKKFTLCPPSISLSAWCEQLLLLALLITGLILFYVPTASFAFYGENLLWLVCQLLIIGVLLRSYWLIRASHHKHQLATLPEQALSWLIGYASQSGYAEQLATTSAQHLRAAGFNVHLATLNNINPILLSQHQRALFVVSTYGEGEPPDNANIFYQHAGQYLESLQQLQYAVLAIGDKSYQQFCAFGHWLHQWLGQREAVALSAAIELDSADNTNTAMQQWHSLLSQVTNQDVIEQDTDSIWQNAELISRYQVNPASTGLPCYVIKLKPLTIATWQAGDVIDIQPHNSKCDVTLWLTQHKVNGCQAVNINGINVPLCWALSELPLTKLTPPRADQAIAAWLSQQPRLALRTYSVASITADGYLMLLVRQVKHANGQLGVGSGWLTAWAPEHQQIQFKLRKHSNFHLPERNIPVLFIANGTGIAGIRALIAARVQRQQTENWLIFGERKRQHDFFFAKDIQQWQQQGYLAHCDLVFSQDQADKHYVQHRLAEQAVKVQQWVAKGGAIYICGSLQSMGEAVDKVLTDILGRTLLQQLQLEGRYRRDLY